MDSAITPYILPIIVVSIVVAILLLSRAFENKQKPVEARTPDDELLIDTYSGKKITVDEARRGVEVIAEEINRIKSEDEILTNYSVSQQAIELANRAMLLAGFKQADYPGNIEELFFDSTVVAGAELENGISYQLSGTDFLLFTHIYYYSQRVNHYNGVIVIETQNNLGNYVLMPANDAQRWISRKLDENTITSIDGFIIERIKSTDNETALIDFLDSLLLSGNIVIETCGNHVFVYGNEEITADHITTLIDIYKQVVLNDFIKLGYLL